MSFFESCTGVHIQNKDDGLYLVCYAQDVYGSYPQAEFRLDEHIGNDDASLPRTFSSQEQLDGDLDR
ncbi:hypothetical protein N7504_011731 [Penicillium tannophilum]|nr:hypothetical protein N7504_011731 [Penicillium tannophilum]